MTSAPARKGSHAEVIARLAPKVEAYLSARRARAAKAQAHKQARSEEWRAWQALQASLGRDAWRLPLVVGGHWLMRSEQPPRLRAASLEAKHALAQALLNYAPELVCSQLDEEALLARAAEPAIQKLLAEHQVYIQPPRTGVAMRIAASK